MRLAVSTPWCGVRCGVVIQRCEFLCIESDQYSERSSVILRHFADGFFDRPKQPAGFSRVLSPIRILVFHSNSANFLIQRHVSAPYAIELPFSLFASWQREDGQGEAGNVFEEPLIRTVLKEKTHEISFCLAIAVRLHGGQRASLGRGARCFLG